MSGIFDSSGISIWSSPPGLCLPWVYRNDVMPATKMLITVPAMI